MISTNFLVNMRTYIFLILIALKAFLLMCLLLVVRRFRPVLMVVVVKVLQSIFYNIIIKLVMVLYMKMVFSTAQPLKADAYDPMSIMGLIGFGLYPFLIGYILRKYSERLDEVEVRNKIGNLYQDVHLERSSWNKFY